MLRIKYIQNSRDWKQFQRNVKNIACQIGLIFLYFL
jgi:hypothetical protein